MVHLCKWVSWYDEKKQWYCNKYKKEITSYEVCDKCKTFNV